jgi:hypothetical protein
VVVVAVAAVVVAAAATSSSSSSSKGSKYKAIPGQALIFPGGSNCQISSQSAHEHGKFVIPAHRPPLPP